MKTRFAGLILTLFTVQPGGSLAQGVDETNYDQINSEDAITVPGPFSATRLKAAPVTVGTVKLGSAFGLNAQGEIIVTAPSTDTDTIVLVLEEDACSIGVQISLPSREQSHSISVEFSFVSRDGQLIETERRWPAYGTTRQSFTSDGFVSRFAAIEIRADIIKELNISGIRICLAAWLYLNGGVSLPSKADRADPVGVDLTSAR